MNIYRHNALRTIVALCIGVLLLSGAALAQDAPDTAPTDGVETVSADGANSYITQLDQLRTMGQQRAMRTTATAANASADANDYATDLQRLNDMAAAGRVRPTANDYSTQLDHLRNMRDE